VRRQHWTALLCALLLGLASAAPATIRLRPQGEALTAAVRAALAKLSAPDRPITLDTSSGPLLALGGTVPFNPEVRARSYTLGGERRIEFNPADVADLQALVESELLRELKLSAFTPEAARQRYSGSDLNGDGKIDVLDLALMMGALSGQGNGSGDLNSDGKIDTLDLNQFLKDYTLP
jgi:Dockerin type I domain